MKSSKNIKIIFAKVLLLLLIIIILIMTYFRFFSIKEVKIDKKNINNSSDNAIHIALADITANFNKNEDVIRYQSVNGVDLKASTKDTSIYVSYNDNNDDSTVNYEFIINNEETLFLTILVDDGSDNEKNKFNIVYRFLVEAVQLRLNNKDEISNKINDFLINDVPCEGLSKSKIGDKIEYKINILDKIHNKEGKSE